MAWNKDYVPPKKGKGAHLTDLQKRFIDEYMVDFVGADAVIRAGYKCSPQNAKRQATELLNHPLVRRYIDERMAEKREKNELSADYVIQNLIEIAEHTKTGNPTAALRALELLGKNLGLFKERQEISGPDGEAIKMEQKVKENVQDFTSKLARLAIVRGAGGMAESTDGSGEG